MFPNVEREPTAIFALSQDFVVGIADVIETCLPIFLCIERQGMRFTGNGVDFTTGVTNRIDDAFFLIAT